MKFIYQQCDENFDLDTIPLDDAKVYRAISDGHTTGIFQLESHGMTRLLQKLQPSNFEDIVATIALFRPGAARFWHGLTTLSSVNTARSRLCIFCHNLPQC